MTISDAILKLLGEALAYGGGGAVVAYLLFQYFGKNWIENKFAQRLEQHKHQQALELQRLHLEIDSMLSGALKLQEREFQLLPEAWQKLDEAHGLVRRLVSPGQEYPNVDRMTPAELEEFLSKSELTETQKQRVRTANNRLKAYEETIFWHRLHCVKIAISDLENFVARNGIFFPTSIKDKFTQISNLFWSAIISKQVGHEAEDYRMQSEGWKKIQEEAEPLYKAIEGEIQARLNSHSQRREDS